MEAEEQTPAEAPVEPVRGEVVDEPSVALEVRAPTVSELEGMEAIARRISSTSFVPAGMRGDEHAVLAAILTGRELGIGPMQALRQIHIIDGRAGFAAELMVGRIRARGHSITGDAKIVKAGESADPDQSRAIVTGTRRDTGDTMTVEWTLRMAQRANLVAKDNWRRYPEAMLWARAVSQLSRMLFPDCFGGLAYTPDELEDMGAEPVASGPRTVDGADTKARTRAAADGTPKMATPAQIKAAGVKLVKLVEAGAFVNPEGEVYSLDGMLAAIAQQYGVEAPATDDEPPEKYGLPGRVAMLLERLSGGAGGAASNLITRLKAKEQELAAAQTGGQ